MLWPYFLTAVVLAVFAYFLNGWIIPECDKKRVLFENQYVRDLKKEHKDNIHRQIEPGVFMYMRDFNHVDSSGTNLTLEKFENGQLKSKLFASYIQWNNETHKWQLTNYMIRTFNGSSEQVVKGARLDTAINFNPTDFFRRSDDVQSFNMRELKNHIKAEEMRGAETVLFYRTEYYKRFSAPFSAFVLTFIGVCVAARKSRGGGPSPGSGYPHQLPVFICRSVYQHLCSQWRNAPIYCRMDAQYHFLWRGAYPLPVYAQIRLLIARISPFIKHLSYSFFF